MVFSVVLLGALLSQATPPARSTAADTQLIEAAKTGDLARARGLLAKGAVPDTADRRGLTPLIWASASGHLELVRQLLESGASVDRRANDGTTALMLASANGFTDIVRILLARGANVAATRGSVDARQLAVARAHADVAALLEQAQTLGTRLLQAATEGHDMAVRQLLASGAPVHADTKSLRGFDAAVAIANATTGRFSFEPNRAAPEKTIQASVTELLLEASRQLDESR